MDNLINNKNIVTELDGDKVLHFTTRNKHLSTTRVIVDKGGLLCVALTDGVLPTRIRLLTYHEDDKLSTSGSLLPQSIKVDTRDALLTPEQKETGYTVIDVKDITSLISTGVSKYVFVKYVIPDELLTNTADDVNTTVTLHQILEDETAVSTVTQDKFSEVQLLVNTDDEVIILAPKSEGGKTIYKLMYNTDTFTLYTKAVGDTDYDVLSNHSIINPRDINSFFTHCNNDSVLQRVVIAYDECNIDRLIKEYSNILTVLHDVLSRLVDATVTIDPTLLDTSPLVKIFKDETERVDVMHTAFSDITLMTHKDTGLALVRVNNTTEGNIVIHKLGYDTVNKKLLLLTLTDDNTDVPNFDLADFYTINPRDVDLFYINKKDVDERYAPVGLGYKVNHDEYVECNWKPIPRVLYTLLRTIEDCKDERRDTGESTPTSLRKELAHLITTAKDERNILAVADVTPSTFEGEIPPELVMLARNLTLTERNIIFNEPEKALAHFNDNDDYTHPDLPSIKNDALELSGYTSADSIDYSPHNPIENMVDAAGVGMTKNTDNEETTLYKLNIYDSVVSKVWGKHLLSFDMPYGTEETPKILVGLNGELCIGLSIKTSSLSYSSTHPLLYYPDENVLRVWLPDNVDSGEHAFNIDVFNSHDLNRPTAGTTIVSVDDITSLTFINRHNGNENGYRVNVEFHGNAKNDPAIDNKDVDRDVDAVTAFNNGPLTEDVRNILNAPTPSEEELFADGLKTLPFIDTDDSDDVAPSFVGIEDSVSLAVDIARALKSLNDVELLTFKMPYGDVTTHKVLVSNDGMLLICLANEHSDGSFASLHNLCYCPNEKELRASDADSLEFNLNTFDDVALESTTATILNVSDIATLTPSKIDPMLEGCYYIKVETTGTIIKSDKTGAITKEKQDSPSVEKAWVSQNMYPEQDEDTGINVDLHSGVEHCPPPVVDDDEVPEYTDVDDVIEVVEILTRRDITDTFILLTSNGEYVDTWVSNNELNQYTDSSLVTIIIDTQTISIFTKDSNDSRLLCLFIKDTSYNDNVYLVQYTSGVEDSELTMSNTLQCTLDSTGLFLTIKTKIRASTYYALNA